MNKCVGCGATLQDKNIDEIGFTSNIQNDLCERCFRIRNYGEYKLVSKCNDEFIEILKNVDKSKDLVILVVDIFNLNKSFEVIEKNISNPVLVVITKRDILPKSIKDEKIEDYIKKYNLNMIETVVISSLKNYNFDRLYELIRKNKKTKNVYVIGYTNAGKSTMINKLIYNYSTCKAEITTSILPSTTLNEIEIQIDDDLNIIDTPGILSDKSFYDVLSGKELKKIIPKKEIKPITYQVKGKQYIMLDKYALIELENINVTLFMSNSINIKRLYKKMDLLSKKHVLKVDNCDIVISGLGFIKCNGKGIVNIYVDKDIDIYTRDCLI